MKFLLDTPISPDKRAIQFSNASSSMEDAAAGDSAEQIAEGTRDSKSVHDNIIVVAAVIIEPPLCFCNCRSLATNWFQTTIDS